MENNCGPRHTECLTSQWKQLPSLVIFILEKSSVVDSCFCFLYVVIFATMWFTHHLSFYFNPFKTEFTLSTLYQVQFQF